MFNFFLCLGPFCATQEDAEELEEPKQVVYKEKGFGTFGYSSEKINDSESEGSRIGGFRNNLLERNGWYSLGAVLNCCGLHNATQVLNTVVIVWNFQCNQVSDFNHDKIKDIEDQQKGLSSVDGAKVYTISFKLLPLKTEGCVVAVFLF